MSMLLCLQQERARTRVGNMVEQCGRFIKLFTAPGACVCHWRLEHLFDIFLFSMFRWAPWFTVDGEDLIQDPNNPNATTSFREMFLLGKKICDTYEIKTGVCEECRVDGHASECSHYPNAIDIYGIRVWCKHSLRYVIYT